MKYRVTFEVNEHDTTVEGLKNFGAEDIPDVAMRMWEGIFDDILNEDEENNKCDIEIVSAELIDEGKT